MRQAACGRHAEAAELWLCGPDLRDKTLSRVLPKWELTPIPIEAVAVAGRFRPARIDAFVDVLSEVMGRLDGFVPA